MTWSTLREKYPYSEFLWSVFYGILTEYGETLRISPYSVRMRKNKDQKNFEYGHFSRSAGVRHDNLRQEMCITFQNEGIRTFVINPNDSFICIIVGDKAKGRISKRVFQENKARQISQKTNISYLLIRTCAYQGVRNVSFSENLACFVFLKHPFWNSPFCLIADVVKIVYRI